MTFNQPPTSCPLSSHDRLLLGFSYVTEVLHYFSWDHIVPDFTNIMNRLTDSDITHLKLTVMCTYTAFFLNESSAVFG